MSSLFSFQGTGAVQRRIPIVSQPPFGVKPFLRGRALFLCTRGARRISGPVREDRGVDGGAFAGKIGRPFAGGGKIQRDPREVKR